MPGSVQSVERAAAIVRLLATGRGRALGDLSSGLGLSKSTVHGILRTLVDVGFVEQDAVSGTYRLSTKELGDGSKPMDINEMRSRATNWVDGLAARTRLAARLIVLPDEPPDQITGGLTAHHVFSASPAPQRVEIGDPVDLMATAEGKVLLALSPAGGQVLEGLLQRERGSRAADTALRDVLAAVRRHGFAVETGAAGADGAGVAVPVRSHGGVVVAALGVRGSHEQLLTPTRYPRQELVQTLDEAARGTSHALMAKRW